MTVLALDSGTATPAGAFNALLGGTTNRGPDRLAAEKMQRVAPGIGGLARATLMFTAISVASAAQRWNIDQMLELGVPGAVKEGGTPAHYIRAAWFPSAPRVVGVEDDPYLLLRRPLPQYDAVVKGNLNDVAGVLDHIQLKELVNLDRPVIVVLAAVLRPLRDPAAAVALLRERLAPGSALVLAHATCTAASQRHLRGLAKAIDLPTEAIFRPMEKIAAMTGDRWELAGPALRDVQFRPLTDPTTASVRGKPRVLGQIATIPYTDRSR